MAERALNSSAGLFWNAAFCGVISFMRNYHLCNFWFCFYGRPNNKNHVVSFCWLGAAITDPPQRVRRERFISSGILGRCSPLRSFLTPERDIVGHFGCIPELFCSSGITFDIVSIVSLWPFHRHQVKYVWSHTVDLKKHEQLGKHV